MCDNYITPDEKKHVLEIFDDYVKNDINDANGYIALMTIMRILYQFCDKELLDKLLSTPVESENPDAKDFGEKLLQVGDVLMNFESENSLPVLVNTVIRLIEKMQEETTDEISNPNKIIETMFNILNSEKELSEISVKDTRKNLERFLDKYSHCFSDCKPKEESRSTPKRVKSPKRKVKKGRNSRTKNMPRK